MAVEDDQFYQLMEKMGEKPDDGPGNTGQIVKGKQPDSYPDPGVDTPVNSEDGSPQFSNGVYDEFTRGRQKFLQRYLDTYGPSQKANAAIAQQALEHAKPGQYEASSAMMQQDSKKPVATQTLLDKTKRALDKY